MNTNYDDEATQYQGPEDEATQYEETSSTEQETPNNVPNDEVQAKPAKNVWKRVAAGAGSGLLIGGLATVLMGMKKADSEPGKETESDNHK